MAEVEVSVFDTWRDIGFIAAPPGWRVVFLNTEDPYKPKIETMPGWLLQEECIAHDCGTYTGGLELIRKMVPNTRVVPGWLETDTVLPVDIYGHRYPFLRCLSPGEKIPSNEELLSEWNQWKEDRDLEAVDGDRIPT